MRFSILLVIMGCTFSFQSCTEKKNVTKYIRISILGNKSENVFDMGTSFGGYSIVQFEKSNEYTVNLLDSKNEILESQKLGFKEDKKFYDDLCVVKNNKSEDCLPVDLKLDYQFEFVEGAYKVELYKGDKKIAEEIIQSEH